MSSSAGSGPESSARRAPSDTAGSPPRPPRQPRGPLAALRSSSPGSPERTSGSDTTVSRTTYELSLLSPGPWTSPGPRRRDLPTPIDEAVPVPVDGWQEACASLPLLHMGRGPADDPWFFAAAFAAGRLARERLGLAGLEGVEPDRERDREPTVECALRVGGQVEDVLVPNPEHPGELADLALSPEEGEVVRDRDRLSVRDEVLDPPNDRDWRRCARAPRRSGPRMRRGSTTWSGSAIA